MRKLALQVEHKFKNRVVGVHLIDGKKPTTTIGSSRTADIRVIGDDIAGLHAAFEREGEDWNLSDLGSESGTWINKKPIIEHKIDGATVIHIGNHQLKATPHVLERELFNKPLSEGKGALVYHQVVIFKKGMLVRSLLLEQQEAFNPELSGFKAALPAPKDFNWTETSEGNYTIKQRLTKSDRVEERVADAFGDEWKRPAP
ncbi:MAG: FHA domain-containing protein, partial [Bdellovibrionales bacterium]